MNALKPSTTSTSAEKPRRSNLVTYLLLVTAVVLASAAAYLWFFQPPTVHITWATENELDTIGYNVYRSDSAEGEYSKVNTTLIPSYTDPTLGGEHSFVDEDVKRGQVYYYKLETIGREGNTESEGPIELTAR
jgi:hypothetical protein